MADGPVSAASSPPDTITKQPTMATKKIKNKKTGDDNNEATSSYNGDVALTNRIDMVNRKLKAKDKDDSKKEKKLERRGQRNQRRQQQIDQLLEQVGKTPSELMFGVRIRRKYAEELSKCYGQEQQPYYAELTDTDFSSYSSEASSSDESSDRIGINSTRINGVNSRKPVLNTEFDNSTAAMERQQTVLNTASSSKKSESGLPLQLSQDAKKRKKRALLPVPSSQDLLSVPLKNATQQAKLNKRESEALYMLNWMDHRIKMEIEQSEQRAKKTNGSKPRSSSSSTTSAEADLNIPPEAMEILKEALISATHNNSNEHFNNEMARVLATNFIETTAASAAASRINQSGSSSSEILPSSSSNSADISGLPHKAAIEVWREIQQYLRNLCLSNSLAQELAAKTAERIKTRRSKDKSRSATPPRSSLGVPATTKLSPTVNEYKKKRKTKNMQAGSYAESVIEQHCELLKLQAEKQQEHAIVVAQLREQEAKLQEQEAKLQNAITASASAQSFWVDYQPVIRPPFKIGSGPYGATYQHGNFAITAHTEWLDQRMIARGLRVYILIWFLERHRLYDYCEVRQQEAKFCLFLHCDKYRGGFLGYICTGNEALETELMADAKVDTFDDFDSGEISFYEAQCMHKMKWERMNWSQICNYHQLFYKIDQKLPLLPGDFVFLMNQMHKAFDDTSFHRRLRHAKQQLKYHSLECKCDMCEWRRKHVLNAQLPQSLPLDSHRHNIELYLPTNYVINRTIQEQRRLLNNQAQLAEKCIVVARQPIVEEEREWEQNVLLMSSLKKSPEIPVNVLDQTMAGLQLNNDDNDANKALEQQQAKLGGSGVGKKKKKRK